MTRSPDDPVALTYGTRLRIRAKLHLARNYRNPGAFDHEGYLLQNGIHVLGSADSRDIERLPGFSCSRIQLWRARMHASIIAKIHLLYPASQASPNVAQFRLDLRMIAGRLKRFIGNRFSLALPTIFMRVAIGVGELIFISAQMQAGLALLMAYHFHRATTMGMPANLAVIPLTQVLMPAAAAAVGLGYISTMLAKPAVWISGFALEGIAGTVHRLGGARLIGKSIADLMVAMPSTPMVLASIADLMAAMLAVRRGRWVTCGCVALLFGAAFWIAFVPSHAQIHRGVIEMTSIDVGQGNSILLVTPEGRTILIDAGGLPQWMHSDFDIGEQVVSSYLWNRGIDRLDVVVVTHPHADHLGGMPAVMANFHPRELWVSIEKPVGELAPVVSQAERAGMKV